MLFLYMVSRTPLFGFLYLLLVCSKTVSHSVGPGRRIHISPSKKYIKEKMIITIERVRVIRIKSCSCWPWREASKCSHKKGWVPSQVVHLTTTSCSSPSSTNSCSHFHRTKHDNHHYHHHHHHHYHLNKGGMWAKRRVLEGNFTWTSKTRNGVGQRAATSSPLEKEIRNKIYSQIKFSKQESSPTP